MADRKPQRITGPQARVANHLEMPVPGHARSFDGLRWPGTRGSPIAERRGEMQARVEELCAVMARGGCYILAPAKAIQAGTPSEISAAVVESFGKNNLREAH